MDNKEQLIQEIISNPNNKYGEKYLVLKSIKQLRNILKSLNK